KSSDGGASWQTSGPPILNSSNVIPVSQMIVDAGSPSVFYAQTAAGFMKSSDGGAHWSNANLPSNLSAFRIVAAAGTVYVVAWGTSGNGSDSAVFRSTDAGQDWNNVTSGLASSQILALAVDPQNPNTIYAGYNGVAKSVDAGATWTNPVVNFAPFTMAIDPHD